MSQLLHFGWKQVTDGSQLEAKGTGHSEYGSAQQSEAAASQARLPAQCVQTNLHPRDAPQWLVHDRAVAELVRSRFGTENNDDESSPRQSGGFLGTPGNLRD